MLEEIHICIHQGEVWCYTHTQVDLRSAFERSEDPDSLLVKDAELRVSKREGSIAQVYACISKNVFQLGHYSSHATYNGSLQLQHG